MTAETVEGRPQGEAAPAQGAGGQGRVEAPGAGAASAPLPGVVRATEVSARPRRRRFSAEYKLKIVEAAERCKGKGEVGALLRREGLYSSHLAVWRREALAGLRERQRGRKPEPVERRRVEQLERECARLKRCLEQTEAIIEVQKKLSALLGIALPSAQLNENDG
ncbi:MAG TPA: transposase [Thermoanaerobaculia bacterium]|nr:transposase [Thermoanaerobaculia bacterium]